LTVTNWGVFKSNITLFSCFNLIPKTGIETPETGASFFMNLLTRDDAASLNLTKGYSSASDWSCSSNKSKHDNLKNEEIVAIDTDLLQLFFVLYFHNSKSLFLILKNHEITDLTCFLKDAAVNCKFLKVTKRWTIVKLV